MKKKLCYLILAHSDPQHLFELISSLNYNALFYVHIDKKVDIEPFKKVLASSDITWILNRHTVSWADISQVNATLSLIKEALTAKHHILRMILLSGTCYPLKAPQFIYSYFENNQQTEYIKYIDMRESLNHYMPQIRRKWFKAPMYQGKNRLLTLLDKALRAALNKLHIKNSWNEDAIPYFGSQWWALTPLCCEYIITFLTQNPWFYEMNKHTFSPDEHFFHTIIGNSHYSKFATGLQTFMGRGTSRLSNLHLIHQSLSKWFTLQDLKEIKNSDKLYIRKLNTIVSSDLIEYFKDNNQHP
jgi:hypothetical protein